ncbi:hypothetical protein [Gordonia polyisoprenivorans]|uniref:hypothetical protein n=1 Tax=Gordonia polyisoprenivorans TaxID=84595 RepID=UPI00036D92E9|nr:hypothetical protein [Gordonia polyisoprenivorans]
MNLIVTGLGDNSEYTDPTPVLDAAWRDWDTAPDGEIRDSIRDAIWAVQDAYDRRADLTEALDTLSQARDAALLVAIKLGAVA